MSNPKIRFDAFIEAVQSTPETHQQVVYLEGYIGKSNEENHCRVYFDKALSDFIDVAFDDILHNVSNTKEEDPLGGSKLWLKAQATYKYGDPAEVKKRPEGNFIEGDLMTAYEQQFSDFNMPPIQGIHPSVYRDCEPTNRWSPCSKKKGCPDRNYFYNPEMKEVATFGCPNTVLPPCVRITVNPPCGISKFIPPCNPSIANPPCGIKTVNPPCFSVKIGCTRWDPGCISRPMICQSVAVGCPPNSIMGCPKPTILCPQSIACPSAFCPPVTVACGIGYQGYYGQDFDPYAGM